MLVLREFGNGVVEMVFVDDALLPCYLARRCLNGKEVFVGYSSAASNPHNQDEIEKQQTNGHWNEVSDAHWGLTPKFRHSRWRGARARNHSVVTPINHATAKYGGCRLH